MKVTIVATRTIEQTVVYGTDMISPIIRPLKAGDFVTDDSGRVFHVVESHNGQGLRYGLWWESWDAFKAQNAWVQEVMNQQEQEAGEGLGEYQDLQATLCDASYRGQW